jgi:hypothetical protein
MAKMVTGLTDLDSVQKGLNEKLNESGEGLFKAASVRDLLFDGFSIQAYLELLNDPAVAQLGDVRIPRAFLSGKFAIYQGV